MKNEQRGTRQEGRAFERRHGILVDVTTPTRKVPRYLVSLFVRACGREPKCTVVMQRDDGSAIGAP